MANVFTGLVDATLAPADYALGQTGYTYVTNGVDPASVRLVPTNNTRLWGVPEVESAPTLGAPAADANGLTGTYFWYVTYYNENSGFRGSPCDITPFNATGQVLAGQKITLTFTDTPPSGYGITHRTVFRNTAGQTNVFYKVADVAIATGTFTDGDSTDESDISIRSANVLLDEDSSVPPQHCPFVREHNGRLHLFGAREESAGTISANSTFTAVTGVGTNFRASHVGQYIYVEGGHGTRYQIATVTDATHLTVTSAFTGTVSGVSFTIRHPTPSRWYWSLPGGKIEAFPFANATDVFPSDGEDITGAFVCNGTLYAAKTSKVYRLAYAKNPSPDGDGTILPALHKRGLINNRCSVEMGSEVYLIDRLGIYLFNGSAQVQNIDVAIRALLQPSDQPAEDRVNYAYAHKWHACWEPIRDRIVFFVTTGTDTEPKTALCFDRTLQQWSAETWPMGITASRLQLDDDGQLRMLVGDENGQRWFFCSRTAMDCSPPEFQSDGVTPLSTVRGTATAGSNNTLTDAAADFWDTDQKLIGCPVYIVRGTGAGQVRIINGNTSTVLTVSTNWTTNPDATSVYRIGAIDVSIVTPWYDLGDPSKRGVLDDMLLYFVPTSDSQCRASLTLFSDLSDEPFTSYSRTREKQDGYAIPSTARGASGNGQTHVYFDKLDGVVRVPMGTDGKWLRMQIGFLDSARNVPILGFDLPTTEEQRLGREAV